MIKKERKRGFEMIKRFEVENFKGFEKRLVFDLTARDYEFNRSLVNNGVVNKAIIYGKNGVGKTEQLHAQESNWTICSHYIKNKLQMD